MRRPEIWQPPAVHISSSVDPSPPQKPHILNNKDSPPALPPPPQPKYNSLVTWRDQRFDSHQFVFLLLRIHLFFPLHHLSNSLTTGQVNTLFTVVWSHNPSRKWTTETTAATAMPRHNRSAGTVWISSSAKFSTRRRHQCSKSNAAPCQVQYNYAKEVSVVMPPAPPPAPTPTSSPPPNLCPCCEVNITHCKTSYLVAQSLLCSGNKLYCSAQTTNYTALLRQQIILLCSGNKLYCSAQTTNYTALLRQQIILLHPCMPMPRVGLLSFMWDYCHSHEITVIYCITVIHVRLLSYVIVKYFPCIWVFFSSVFHWVVDVLLILLIF